MTFPLLKALSHVKHWWETYWEQSSTEMPEIYGADPTWDFFVDAVKEQYYPVGNYENSTRDGPHYDKRGAKQFQSSPIPSIPYTPSWVSKTPSDIWF